MNADVRAVEYHLPASMLTNHDLEALFPEWPAAKISEKTGIDVRHISAPKECGSDLAVAAAQKLFASGVCKANDIDYLLYCTQTPDYFMPTTACLVQDRLGIPMRAGALDYNLGCSGYIYGLSLAKGLIETGQASNVLLLTADTLSKYINPEDRGVRSLLGDAAAATLVQSVNGDDRAGIGPFVFGTDGQGRDNLIVRAGGLRQRSGGPEDNFYMNGPEIFTFALRVVPPAIKELLEKARLKEDEVDLFIFHQANAYMLEHLRQKLAIPPEKFVLAMRHCGNTSSCSIPIALKEACVRDQLRSGMRLLLVAFGVGYSWGATLVQWN